MIFKPQKEVNLRLFRVTPVYQFMSNNTRQNLQKKRKNSKFFLSWGFLPLSSQLFIDIFIHFYTEAFFHSARYLINYLFIHLSTNNHLILIFSVFTLSLSGGCFLLFRFVCKRYLFSVVFQSEIKTKFFFSVPEHPEIYSLHGKEHRSGFQSGWHRTCLPCKVQRLETMGFIIIYLSIPSESQFTYSACSMKHILRFQLLTLSTALIGRSGWLVHQKCLHTLWLFNDQCISENSE